MKKFLKSLLVLSIFVCWGCSAKNVEAPEPVSGQEEEPIESVYQKGREMTVCIFTPSGDNGAGFTGDLSKYGLKHLSLVIPIGRVREKIDSAIHQ